MVRCGASRAVTDVPVRQTKQLICSEVPRRTAEAAKPLLFCAPDKSVSG